VELSGVEGGMHQGGDNPRPTTDNQQ